MDVTPKYTSRVRRGIAWIGSMREDSFRLEPPLRLTKRQREDVALAIAWINANLAETQANAAALRVDASR